MKFRINAGQTVYTAAGLGGQITWVDEQGVTHNESALVLFQRNFTGGNGRIILVPSQRLYPSAPALENELLINGRVADCALAVELLSSQMAAAAAGERQTAAAGS